MYALQLALRSQLTLLDDAAPFVGRFLSGLCDCGSRTCLSLSIEVKEALTFDTMAEALEYGAAIPAETYVRENSNSRPLLLRVFLLDIVWVNG